MDLSKREMAILGALVVAAAVLYFFLLVPTGKERARLTAESKRLTQKSAKIQKALNAVPKGEEGLKEAQERLEKIRARLLPPDGLSFLFAEISRPSKRLGVRIVSFTPKAPDPTQDGQITADLVVQGTYLELGQYLEDLFGGRYLISVADLKMRPVKSGDPRLGMHVTLQAWMQQESSR